MAKHTYTPTQWVNDSSPDITEDNLNNIEQGIVNAQDTANTNVDDIATNTANIATNKSNIATNTANINALGNVAKLTYTVVSTW